MRKRNLQKGIVDIVVIVTVFMMTSVVSCRSTKNTGSTKTNPTTYPSAHGYDKKSLSFSYSDLAPFAEAEKIKNHYEVIHSQHLAKLNKVVFASKYMMGKSLEELFQNLDSIPNEVRNTVRVDGGGHWNYTFFWQAITDEKNTEPSKELEDAIEDKWGSMGKFGASFTKAATVKYGQCWVWLVNTKKGLKISVTQSNDNPLMDLAKIKGKPILVVPMKQQTFALTDNDKRGLDTFWNIVNWERASKLFNK
jgi:Fe-Mn family superoxide dismutase